MIKPLALRPGDRVGLVAPGAFFNKEAFQKSVQALKKMGLVPVFGKNLFKKDLIFAGTVAQRTQSFKEMVNRTDIRAIWYVRGGCGAYEVTEKISDMKIPRGEPKILIGMSDATALHLLVMQKWKWPV